MTRWLIVIASVFVLMAGIQADDAEKKPPAEQKGDELKKEKKPATPEKTEAESDEAKILERLTKNSKTAEEKLGEADTSDETRKLQREILKDIDELLKKSQQPPQDPQSDSSSSSSSADQKPMDGSSSAQQKPMDGSSSSQQKSSGSSSQQKSGMSRREQREQKRQQQAKNSGASAQNSPKPMGQDPMANAGQDPKNPMGGKPGGKPPPEIDPKLAEMYKDVWGHLPEKMRQEMDTYFKDRFMPRYNDLLKQYYSTIAEQNKKK